MVESEKGVSDVWIVLRNKILRVSSDNSEKCWKGQNLDHLYTIPIQTGLVDIKTGPSIFGPTRTYMIQPVAI